MTKFWFNADSRAHLIEFDHAFFIRQTAKAHAVIFGIVFGTLHHSERRVECVSAAAEELVRVPEIVVTIPGTNDDRAFAACLCDWRRLGLPLFSILPLRSKRE